MATRTSASPKKATTKKKAAKTTKRKATASKTTKKAAARPRKATASKNSASGATSAGSSASGSSSASSSASGSATGSSKSSAKAQSTPPAARRASRKPAERSVFLPRAVASVDDDDPLMAHGGGGTGFGRCGGRLLSNRLEQQLCHRLGIAGVVHSHSPRHYEIRYDDSRVAAYAPMIVLRGRGREGKGVVIEAIEEPKAAILKKIIAFRAQYGQEFYVILVASDEVLDEVALAAYDESCSSTNVHTLIARLAE